MYLTLSQSASASFTERKSEFIGNVKPVQTEDDATAFIAEIRAKHPKARHNPSAYILREGNVTRFSDDGEPSGTAGRPILDVLSKKGLTDCVCVVTRYFGGILLGAGGLVRAYSQGAKIAVEAAGLAEMHESFLLTLEMDYTYYNVVGHFLKDFEAVVKNAEFTDNVKLDISVKASFYEAVTEKISEMNTIKITQSQATFEQF
jgi:uncharacterized YigZ family protein